jgi:hypothetical protein
VANASLQIGNMSIDQVFSTLQTQGVGSVEASTLIGDWLLHNSGNAHRVFSYLTPFSSADPECAPTFKRVLHHVDWIDGESVVQAEQTSIEDGFNLRFHNIEKDLDGLSADTARLYLCLGEMRQSLNALLGEIRVAINQLNDDVFNLQGGSRVTPGPILGVGAKQATFVGATKYFGQDVNVWDTSQGTILLPAVTPPPTNVLADPRVQRATMLSTFLTDHPEAAQTLGPGPFTTQDVISKLGTQVIGGTTTIADAVAIVPPGTTFNSVNDVVNAVSTGEAAALRTTSGTPEAVASTFGVGTDVQSVAAAPVDRFDALPQGAAGALKNAGIDTMDKLAAADPGTVATALQHAGVASSAGQVAGWKTAAQTLIRVQP